MLTYHYRFNCALEGVLDRESYEVEFEQGYRKYLIPAMDERNYCDTFESYYHFENGFIMMPLSALKEEGFRYINLTGGYEEIVEPSHEKWAEAKPIKEDASHRLLKAFEYTELVPNLYNPTGKRLASFNQILEKTSPVPFEQLEKLALEWANAFELDAILVVPPAEEGRPRYVGTRGYQRSDGSAVAVDDVPLALENLNLTTIVDAYFANRDKAVATMAKQARERGADMTGVAPAKRYYVEPFFSDFFSSSMAIHANYLRGKLPACRLSSLY